MASARRHCQCRWNLAVLLTVYRVLDIAVPEVILNEPAAPWSGRANPLPWWSIGRGRRDLNPVHLILGCITAR